MAYLVDVATMREMEAEADKRGIPFDMLMDRAGAAVAQAVIRHQSSDSLPEVVAICGPGNNGGDGMVAALRLVEHGYRVHVFATQKEKSIARLMDALQASGVPVEDFASQAGRDSFVNTMQSADVVLDAILGTGSSLPLKEPVASILKLCRATLAEIKPRKPYVIAVDCPSGVHCDSGEADENTIEADLTVTFGAVKQGLLKFPGAEYVGNLIVADIGIPDDLTVLKNQKVKMALPTELSTWIVQRSRNSHKGTFGRTILVGGSVNFPGAPILAAKGAYRIGAGLVSIAAPLFVSRSGATLLPEATWIILPDEFGVIQPDACRVLREEEKNADSIVIGPGIGQEKQTAEFIKEYLAGENPQKAQFGFGGLEKIKKDPQKIGSHGRIVFDADSLKHLVSVDEWWKFLPEGCVVTPHPGEMSVMTGLSKQEIQNERIKIASKFSREWNVVIVLKGAFTIVANPKGEAMVVPFATAALSRAGTGDVLAGMIGGLIAQGMGSYEASVLGSYLHGRAGELAEEKIGDSASVIAGDVVDRIADALRELRAYR